jgi:hypothetical protein
VAEEITSQPAAAKPGILPKPPPIVSEFVCSVDPPEIALTGGESVQVTAYVIAAPVPASAIEFEGLPVGVTASSKLVSSNATTHAYTYDITFSADANTTAAANTAVQVNAVRSLPVGTALPRIATATLMLNTVAYGQISLSHVVLALIYAPPGTSGGKASSSVSYASTSTTGTTIDLSQSFKTDQDTQASVTISGGVQGVVNIGFGLSGEFESTTTSTDESALTISKSETKELDATGPGTDGVDHTQDVFYLWLNPVMIFTIDAQGAMKWSLAYPGTSMDIQYAYVSWLKDPTLMQQQEPHVYESLQSAGVTPEMYADILALHPFANGGTDIDPARFLPVDEFPYEGPTSPTNPVQVNSRTFTSTTSSVNTLKTDASYKVALGVDVSLTLGPATASLKAELKVTDSMTVDATSTQTSTTSSTQTIKATIGGPAFGWSGQTHVRVYLDTLYNSFMFVLADT